MANTGVKYPATVTEVSNATETIVWATTDLKAVGGAIAEVTSNSFDADITSRILECTNFSMGISTSAVIDGVLVAIYKQCDTGTIRCVDYRVQLMNGTGVYIGTNKADTTTAWAASYATANYGGATDMWGLNTTTLTAAIVNGSGFGVAISATSKDTNSECQIDYLRVTVYYHIVANVASTTKINMKAQPSRAITTIRTSLTKFSNIATALAEYAAGITDNPITSSVSLAFSVTTSRAIEITRTSLSKFNLIAVVKRIFEGSRTAGGGGRTTRNIEDL